MIRYVLVSVGELQVTEMRETGGSRQVNPGVCKWQANPQGTMLLFMSEGSEEKQYTFLKYENARYETLIY